MRARRAQGFTLIELIIVIVLTGIIAVVVGVLISGTVGGYVDQSNRAELVSKADQSLRRMAREVRHALPNNIRTDCGGLDCLEFLYTETGGAFRLCEGEDQEDCLPEDEDFTEFDSSQVSFSNGNYHLSAHNFGQNTAWSGASMGAATGVSQSTVDGRVRISLTDAQRIARLERSRPVYYLVSGPVAFVCEDNAVWRYSDYDPLGGSFDDAASRTRLVDGVVDCDFDFSGVGFGVVTLALTLAQDGEEIRLLHQVHVLN